MNLSWMKANRLSVEYMNEMIIFLQFGERNLSENNGIFLLPLCFFVGIQNIIERKKH